MKTQKSKVNKDIFKIAKGKHFFTKEPCKQAECKKKKKTLDNKNF